MDVYSFKKTNTVLEAFLKTFFNLFIFHSVSLDGPLKDSVYAMQEHEIGKYSDITKQITSEPRQNQVNYYSFLALTKFSHHLTDSLFKNLWTSTFQQGVILNDF